jgi:hypothetical protein
MKTASNEQNGELQSLVGLIELFKDVLCKKLISHPLKSGYLNSITVFLKKKKLNKYKKSHNTHCITCLGYACIENQILWQKKDSTWSIDTWLLSQKNLFFIPRTLNFVSGGTYGWSIPFSNPMEQIDIENGIVRADRTFCICFDNT